jgi:hypothetical protein
MVDVSGYRGRPLAGSVLRGSTESATRPEGVAGRGPNERNPYEAPETDTWLLFPYELGVAGKPRLIEQKKLEARFPQAWAYLKLWEQQLRARESKTHLGKTAKPFDDSQWYRFGRNQNLDKQERPKLIVAQTVPGMRV